MSVISASRARANLYQLVDEVAETHKPILITGKRSNAVLISEKDWGSIQARAQRRTSTEVSRTQSQGRVADQNPA